MQTWCDVHCSGRLGEGCEDGTGAGHFNARHFVNHDDHDHEDSWRIMTAKITKVSRAPVSKIQLFY